MASQINRLNKDYTMQEAVLTPEFRLSFPALFVPTPDDNGVLRFRMEMLFPKTREYLLLLQPMKALYNATIPQSWATDGGCAWRTFEQALIDGNQKKQEERKNHFILRANSGPKYPPRLLNPNKTQASEADLYAGCYCRAILTTFSWQTKNKQGAVINRGASFNISTVQKTRDGDPFSRSISAAAADAMLDEAPLTQDEFADLLG
jgi:hypothetical protein